jgi:Cu(I)-responsive transcriptional regulator
MNIGEVAERAGLPAKTVRYYEEIGLIRSDRRANGYRRFGPQHLHKLRFLARARRLGFSIDDCRALLALWEDKQRASAEVKRIATHHLAEVEARIAELHAMKATLRDLVEHCAGDQRPDCPILDDLSEGRDLG